MSKRNNGNNSNASTWLRCCLVMFAIVSALCVSGPAIYWKLKKSVSLRCPTCNCHCPPPKTLLAIAPGLANLSATDCGSNDPDLKQELRKQFVDLLNEELKLQGEVVREYTRHANITLNDARKVASTYQKETEKCNTATETCEGARERAEALMRKEKKLTSLWEQRARQFGFQGE
ncbi:hypothetical protein LIER_31028 [Lithospermum erythrorhizon]|uniref:Transmembrane protein n=1 Tax=Lithospermum erythrorhizon TaxID=34254 RepID=A0AAV3RRH9_LITER